MLDHAVVYPPNGVVPFHGFALFCAPFCYVYSGKFTCLHFCLISSTNDKYSIHFSCLLWCFTVYTCQVWEMLMLPSNAPCYSKLALSLATSRVNISNYKNSKFPNSFRSVPAVLHVPRVLSAVLLQAPRSFLRPPGNPLALRSL